MRSVLGCLLLSVVGCGGAELGEPLAEQPTGSEEMPVNVGDSRELARFDAAGNAVEIHELASGGLLIVERGTVGEPSRLDGLVGEVSLSELYSEFVDGAVPDALADYDLRVPARVSEEPTGLRLMHESGSTHFRDSHCAESPTISVGNDPVTVRSFCWSSGYTNGYTESAKAGTFTHEISSVSGPICYTAKDDETSKSFEIASGSYLKVWRTNDRIQYDVPCPSGAVCSGLGLPRVASMSGVVGCATGDTWRFGGGFWKPNPDIYTPGE